MMAKAERQDVHIVLAQALQGRNAPWPKSISMSKTKVFWYSSSWTHLLSFAADPYHAHRYGYAAGLAAYVLR